MSGSDHALLTRAAAGARGNLLRSIRKHHFYYYLMLPGLIYFLIFKYLPMIGISISFLEINPFIGLQGIIQGKWIGFKNFEKFFSSYFFGNIVANTFIISGLKLLFTFPTTIALALLINELVNVLFKRVVQTISYLPHFISWVVVAGLAFKLFATSGGLVNHVIEWFGGESLGFLGDPRYFRSVLIATHVWKEIGWGTIIILAALAGVNPELYESAIIDGANKWQQVIRITLPSIAMVISILLIFNIGNLINAGFEQVLLLYNPLVYDVSDIIDTYVYREGLQQLNFSYAAAVGVFKSVTALAMVVIANFTAKRLEQEGLW